MKSNIEILKEKRSLVIAELTSAFQFKQFELKDLMTGFVAYLEEEKVTLFDEKDSAIVTMIKRLVEYFYDEKSEEMEINWNAKHKFEQEQLNNQRKLI